VRYPQWLLLLMAILGILSGCRSARDLERFSRRHYQAFAAALDLELPKAPCDSTFLYLFERVELEELFRLLREWMLAQIADQDKDFDQLICDGKTLRGSAAQPDGIDGATRFVTQVTSEALQNALEACGGVPAEHRTDSPSACFRNRDGSYAGDYSSRYRELCAHLGVIATRDSRGVAHENGAIEGPDRHWKHRLEQQLLQRGSRDFETKTDYRQLVAQVSATLNKRYEVKGRLEIEQLHLQPLPIERFADYDPLVARVRSTCTIEVRSVTYSVPSRLIGQQLTVHLRHDWLDLFLRSHYVETLPQLHAQKGQKALRSIDFRHVIESLRRKPRALLRARLQDDLLPGESWRQLWRQLLAALPPDEAAKVMVDALHVAARTDNLSGVQRYLRRALRSGELTMTALCEHYDCGNHGALRPCPNSRSLNTN